MVHPRLKLPRRRVLVAAALPWLAACAAESRRAGEAAPPLLREFRAAWVATVANIDWPSRRDLSSAEQRAELQALLDRAQAIGLNAIVLQVRPCADALYPSALEPWSEYLTGVSGRAPDPPWDPLAEWVHEAHRRGLELHAWFNPYRVRHPSAGSDPAASHVSRAEPAIVQRYGPWLWMDPGEPRSAQRMLDVVLDVVRRYDIDAVHLDDYFYPYPINDAAGVELPFPDQSSWARYQAAGGRRERDDWRRGNVDALIETLYREVHRAKPWVRVGISPFGLPRPDLRPAGIDGFSQFHKLYADVEHWLQQGWLDYLAPQLYWPIAQTAQAFEPLLDTWLALNTRGRHLWPGLFTSRIGAPANGYAAQEVLAQIERARLRTGCGGHLHFSMVALAQDREGITTLLRTGPYAQAAPPPATPWLDEPAPGPVEARWSSTADGAAQLVVTAGRGAPLRQIAVQRWRGHGPWRQELHGAPLALAFEPKDERIAVTGLGRSGLATPTLLLARGRTGWRTVPAPP